MVQLAFAVALAVAMGLAGRLPDGVGLFEPARLSLGFGFLLLEAYLLGELAARVRLPKISGYILTGVLCGPHALGFIDAGLAADMKLIDDLALTFIALTAGAELKLATLRARGRTIALVVLCMTAVASLGVAAEVRLVASHLPFTAGMEAAAVLAVAAMFGVVAVARSPTSAIALIRECRASGPFTETLFGVTVAMDSLVILLFAVVVSFGEAVLAAAGGVNLGFVGVVLLQLGVSLLLGVVMGRALAHYIQRVERELTVVLCVLSFLVTYASRWLYHAVDAALGVAFHLEPLLIAIAAGFVVQNFTPGGKRLARSLDAISLPIFVVFFSMAGVTLRLDALASTWGLALQFAAVQMLLTSSGAYFGCSLAGEAPRFRRLLGLGLYTQAGVSLGLAQELGHRFPGWGEEAAGFLLAVISINQLVGPVTFKFALDRAGESGRAAAPDAAAG